MADSFLETTIREYLGQLGSGEPTPGGGAAAALSSAQGAALVMMVANHTIGKERYAEYEELNVKARDEASGLMKRLAAGIDNDAAAFGGVSEAYALPKTIEACSDEYKEELRRYVGKSEDGSAELDDDDAKAAREVLIAVASIGAAAAPLEVMEDSLAGLRLAKDLLGKSNPNLKSDVYVAALMFDAGIKSAAYNVKVNLSAIKRRDPERSKAMGERCDEILAEAGDIIREMGV